MNIFNSRFKIKQDGFNLVEVLVIIAIFVILISSVTSLVSRRISETDLDAKANEIIGIVDKARSYSIAGFQGDVWGIKVLDHSSDCTDNADCVIMFKGFSYADRDSGFDQEVSLDTGNTGTYLESSQTNEFHFSISSGWLSTSTVSTSTEQLIVIKSNTGGQRSVVINPTGVASLFVCGEDKVFDIEGNSYDTVKIGDQCWMRENLNMGTMLASGSNTPSDNGSVEKWCFDNDSSNCDTYGGLYGWNEVMNYVTTEGAQGICPAGWHIPSTSELTTLEGYFPSASNATELLLNGYSNMDLLKGGERNDDGSGDATDVYFDTVGSLSTLWSSTQGLILPDTQAYVHYVVDPDTAMDNTSNPKTYGFSIRCLKDY